MIPVFAAVLTVGGASVAATSYDEYGNSENQAADSLNVVVQWNRVLLVIVRTPGAQSATVHPTRSFAIMHAAIYDAVNAIDRSHKPYVVRLTDVSRFASRDAGAASAAHEVLAASTRSSKQCLTTNFNALWLRFPTAPIGAKASHLGRPSQTRFSRCAATTGQMRRQFALSSQILPPLEPTNPRRLISPSSRNSLIGLTSRLLRCNERINFVLVLPRG